MKHIFDANNDDTLIYIENNSIWLINVMINMITTRSVIIQNLTE
jgi:hypothetical protein